MRRRVTRAKDDPVVVPVKLDRIPVVSIEKPEHACIGLNVNTVGSETLQGKDCQCDIT